MSAAHKYWNNMYIYLKSKICRDQLYLSHKKPDVIDKNDCIVLTSNAKKCNLNLSSLSEFYCKYYKIGLSNNLIYLNIKDLQNFLYIDAEILTLHNLKHLLIGSIISILIPINISDEREDQTYSTRFNFFRQKDKAVFACTSFLILDSKYRKKGYGMKLIQESLQILYDNGGRAAYFINNVSRCDNSIKLNLWYFPLNLEKLDNCNFPYPNNYKSKFIVKCCDNITQVDENNCKEAFDFYISLVQDKKFAFYPSFEYWVKWIHSFPTYFNEYGIFSFNTLSVWYPVNRVHLITTTLILSVSKSNCELNMIKTILYTAKINNSDIINIYEVGNISDKLLVSLFFQQFNTSYMNFYNTSLTFTKEDVYVPLF